MMKQTFFFDLFEFADTHIIEGYPYRWLWTITLFALLSWKETRETEKSLRREDCFSDGSNIVS